jgi:ribosomal protein S18 acetylase RimI-like enzyme
MRSAGRAAGMPEIRLQPMTDAEFAAYCEAAVPAYAAEMRRSDGVPEERSMEQARASWSRLLPKGLATPGHTLQWVHDATTGDRVGHLWLFLDPEAPRAYVYDIEIRPEFRRRGYAEATLAAAEQLGRAGRAERLELHVFGHNRGAIALYEKLGFATTHRMMAKML